MAPICPPAWPLAVTDDLSASVPLGPPCMRTLTVSDAHFEAQMMRQKVLLALGRFGHEPLFDLADHRVIRRFITGPDRNPRYQCHGGDGRRARGNRRGGRGRRNRPSDPKHPGDASTIRPVAPTRAAEFLDRHVDGHQQPGTLQHACRAGRPGGCSHPAEKCSLLFIDIDNFKFVNDKHGHDVGDELLKTLAARIARDVGAITRRRGQEPAILARLSGDEFARSVAFAARRRAVREVCGAILALFSDGLSFPASVIRSRQASALPACPDDASSVAELISKPTLPCTRRRAPAKNRSARFSRALNDKRTRQRQIQDELRSLDPDEQFHLVYMPIVDAGGKVTGCEALLRWHSPVLGHVTPDEFVPIAESSVCSRNRLVGHRQGDVGLPPAEGAVRPRYGSGDQHLLGRTALEVDQRPFFGLPHAPRPGGAIDRHRAYRNVRRPDQRSLRLTWKNSGAKASGSR